MKTSVRIILLLFISIILLSMNPTVTKVSDRYELSNDSNVSPFYSVANYISHNPIIISSDADLMNQALSEGWSGNGNAVTPYLIEDYSLTTSNTCIDVANISLYLVILHCLFTSTSDVPTQGGLGVAFNNVTHGTVSDCHIDNKNEGIVVYNSPNCTIIGITFGDCYNSNLGVQLALSPWSLINNITIQGSYQPQFSIKIEGSHQSVVSSSIITTTYGGVDSIRVDGSDECNITGNECSGASYYGLRLSDCYNSTVKDNSLQGLSLFNSDYTLVANCIFTKGVREGVRLESSSGCMFADNQFMGCGVAFIGLSYMGHSFSGNTVDGKELGYYTSLENLNIDSSVFGQIILASCTNITLYDGDLSVGPSILSCSNCTLTNLRIHNNTGIDVRCSENIIIMRCDVQFCINNGIILITSSYCQVRNNTLSYNQLNGIELYGQSDYCLITYNTVSHNNGVGIKLSGYYPPQNCQIYGNLIGWNLESNAKDDGVSNVWDDGVGIGNFWSDYDGSGTYQIPGIADSVDRYPSLFATTSTTSSVLGSDTTIIIVTLGAAGVGIIVVVAFKKRLQ